MYLIPWNSIEKYLIDQKCNDDNIIGYYRNFLQKVLWYNEIVITELSVNDIFGGYEPELTPDELYDFNPAIYDMVQELPAAEIQNLPELLTQYEKYRKLAGKNAGKWVEGNIVLGANPKEYEPSSDELMLCEAGDRLQIIKESNQLKFPPYYYSELNSDSQKLFYCFIDTDAGDNETFVFVGTEPESMLTSIKKVLKDRFGFSFF